MTTQERDLRQEWETPQDFFDVVDAEFDFQLDAAATAENTKCILKYITPEDDALAEYREWICQDNYGNHRIWLNPGFAKAWPWMKKAYEEAQKHPSAVVAVMAIPSFSTYWWRRWAMKASEIRLLGGRRVQFVAPEGVEQSSNARENCLIIFRPNPHDIFSPHIWTWDWTAGL